MFNDRAVAGGVGEGEVQRGEVVVGGRNIDPEYRTSITVRESQLTHNSQDWRCRNDHLCSTLAIIAQEAVRCDVGPDMRTIVTFAWLSLFAGTAHAQQPADPQSVKIGPWTIATTYKADKFESCTMTRSTPELGAAFVRNRDGLLLTLDSPAWKLERGKAYAVRLAAGSRAVDAQALAESKSVTIAFADRAFNERLRAANLLEVRGEGATLRVPLDGSAAALERLNVCFEKNRRESPDTNPFVAPARKP